MRHICYPVSNDAMRVALRFCCKYSARRWPRCRRGRNQSRFPEISVTDSRARQPASPASSTSIITAADIARSPSYSLTDILSQEAGIQTQNTFGGVNGARSTVDLRGFGATGAVKHARPHQRPPRSTISICRRRLLRHSARQHRTRRDHPRQQRRGALRRRCGRRCHQHRDQEWRQQPPSARIEGAFGSYNHREGKALERRCRRARFPRACSATRSARTAIATTTPIRRYNGVGDFRYTSERGSLYLNVTADDQKLGAARLPPCRASDRAQPGRDRPARRDHAIRLRQQTGQSATAGAAVTLMPGVELIIDGGVRQKHQQAAFFVKPF